MKEDGSNMLGEKGVRRHQVIVCVRCYVLFCPIYQYFRVLIVRSIFLLFLIVNPCIDSPKSDTHLPPACKLFVRVIV